MCARGPHDSGSRQENKTYARWPPEPGMHTRIRCQHGALAAEIHIKATTSSHIIHSEPSPHP
ncbi:hypothetical protein BST32_16470 [Mycobacteroides abscessus subsp. massiliense]|nr:hypothetical protein MMAS_03740 [Mycobacteroides abscessus subsp. massiliense CCUG 48898 = JCM 15300]EIV69297.1 hypothetical protein MMCCUG48898_0237 [Mycobacteroides abscessus subsp. massiliense CCUG 48898 = JCM 15300]ORA88163.1 hypothetical protein BST32_16470 [Mycobacteroides abscessus subsp. massiliense]